MAEQLELYAVEKSPKRHDDKLRRKWENGFQRWSNKAAQDESTSDGVCGFGAICDHCEDNTYGKPCVRALNAMLREKRLSIDYEKVTYEEVWNGRCS